MSANGKKSKTSLLLMEIIITVGIFMVCGALCIRFFTNAHVMEKESTEKSTAVVLAESAVNVINSYDSALGGLVECFPNGELVNDHSFAVHYNDLFEECLSNYEYEMLITMTPCEDGCLGIEVAFSDKEQNEIYKLSTKKANNF